MDSIHEQLEQALRLIRTWPPERQEDAVHTLLAMHQSGTTVYRLSATERADIKLGLEQAHRGERVNNEIMEAFFERHGV